MHQLPSKPSIAILHFVNLSGDPEQEYFSDGITEDIVTALSRLEGLHVVSTHSTKIYKGNAIDVRRVGKEQDVSHVLEGSVRKMGNRVRVSVQLSDASHGHHIWTNKYDRDLDDVFAVQDDIAHRVTVEMRVHVSEGEKARMLAGRTKSVAAWEMVMRADELGNRYNRLDNRKARQLVEEALRLDPDYASAWTELGWTHWEDVFCGWAEDADGSLEQAMAAARRALDIEQEYPNALSLLGLVHLLKGDHELAVELTEKAFSLAPGNAENAAEFAHALTFAGNTSQALTMLDRAMALSPVYPAWYLVTLGATHYLMGELDTAINAFRQATSIAPSSTLASAYLVSALVETKSLAEAKRVAAEVMGIDPQFRVANWRGSPFRDHTISAKIVDNLIRADLPK